MDLQISNSESKSSIEVRKLTKGEWGWTINLYYNREKETYTKVVEEIQAINDTLKAKFKTGDNGDNRDL